MCLLRRPGGPPPAQPTRAQNNRCGDTDRRSNTLKKASATTPRLRFNARTVWYIRPSTKPPRVFYARFVQGGGTGGGVSPTRVVQRSPSLVSPTWSPIEACTKWHFSTTICFGNNRCTVVQVYPSCAGGRALATPWGLFWWVGNFISQGLAPGRWLVPHNLTLPCQVTRMNYSRTASLESSRLDPRPHDHPLQIQEQAAEGPAYHHLRRRCDSLFIHDSFMGFLLCVCVRVTFWMNRSGVSTKRGDYSIDHCLVGGGNRRSVRRPESRRNTPPGRGAA